MKISRPSPSMVVAGIALFVSLGGTSSPRSATCATPARSTARARCSPARRCARPRESSWPPTAPATTRAASRQVRRRRGKTQPSAAPSTSPTTRPERRSPPALSAASAAHGDLQRPEHRGGPRIRSRSSRSSTVRPPVNVARRVGNGDGAPGRRQPNRDVDRHRRVEHVHVPHRARGPERDHHRRRPAGRAHDRRGDLRCVRSRDPVLP